MELNHAVKCVTVVICDSYSQKPSTSNGEEKTDYDVKCEEQKRFIGWPSKKHKMPTDGETDLMAGEGEQTIWGTGENPQPKHNFHSSAPKK